MKTESVIPLKSLQRAFGILETIKNHDGARLADLAAERESPTSTIHNHLRSLEEMGYIVNDGGVYRLGLRFIHFGDHARQGQAISLYGKSTLDELAERTGEMANLLVEEYGRGIYVEVSRSDRSLHLDSYIQEREYLHCTALGQAILAYYDEERVREIANRHGLPRMTEMTITDIDDLLDELETVREQGYALDVEERMEGLVCCAAPILGEMEEPVGAISVSGPKSRLNGDFFFEDVPQIVRDSANAIEIDINHS